MKELVMTGRKNLKISESAYEKHSKRKQELGVTWEGYLDKVKDPVTIEEAAKEGARQAIKEAIENGEL